MYMIRQCPAFIIFPHINCDNTLFLAEATDLSFIVIQRKCYGKEKIWNKMCVTKNEKITKPLFQLASLFFSESQLHTRYILILGCSSIFKKKNKNKCPL